MQRYLRNLCFLQPNLSLFYLKLTLRLSLKNGNLRLLKFPFPQFTFELLIPIELLLLPKTCCVLFFFRLYFQSNDFVNCSTPCNTNLFHLKVQYVLDTNLKWRWLCVKLQIRFGRRRFQTNCLLALVLF
jgi:hypothetical protein